VPHDLSEALDALRPLLLDLDTLVRGIGSGRRRNLAPSCRRVDLRPVDLRGGRFLQLVTSDDDGPPRTRNVPVGPEAEEAVEALLAEPFGNWHVETLDRIVQLRVTKRGQAQVHSTRTSRRDVAPSSHDRVRQHLLPPDDPLFSALGADADKRRQVDAFLRHLAAVVRPPEPGRPLRVVDLGCGNAYLTFAAHRWLGDRFDRVRTIGVDVRADSVERNTRLAAELGMPDLSFVASSIDEAELPAGPDDGAVDLVLALHACDTATDQALARAVRWRAGVVLAAPCCHHDLQRQLTVARSAGHRPPSPFGVLTRHPILRERLADVLTDAVRAELLDLLGYRTEVVEFVDSRHTPRNVLLRAVRSATGEPRRSHREYLDLVTAWGVRPALAGLLGDEVAAVLAADPEAGR